MVKAFVMKRAAIALVLVGVVAGAAGAQVFQAVQRARYIDTGLFTVQRDESVSFHVSLIGRREGSPAQLRLRLFDETGAVAVREEFTLQAGETATLRYDQPGLFRAQAEILDPPFIAGQPGVTASVEIIDDLTAEIRPVCGPGENLPTGRQ